MNFKLKFLFFGLLLLSVFPIYKLTEGFLKKNNLFGQKFDLQLQTNVDTDVQTSDETSDAQKQETLAKEASSDINYDSEKEEVTDAEEKEEAKEESSDTKEIEKELEEIDQEAKKNSTIANIVKVVDNIVKNAYKDKETLTLESLINSLLPVSKEKSELEKYFGKIEFKKPVVKKFKNSYDIVYKQDKSYGKDPKKKLERGLRIKSKIIINKNPLKVCIEIGKFVEVSRSADETGISRSDWKWYALFYIKSPEKWKISDYIPEVLEINKLIPGLDKKYLNSDMLEFEKSILYVSTASMDGHKKLGKVNSGAGLKGKFIFSGFLSDIQKLFGNKPIDFVGKINIPKFEGSKVVITFPDEFKLGNVAGVLVANTKFKNSDIENYLNKLSFKKASLTYIQKGLNLKSTVYLNNNRLKTTLDIAKDDDKKLYALFAIESPEKWKLSDYFSDFFNLAKMIPGINKSFIDKFPKDLFEFEKSFFYISTAKISGYKRKIIEDKEEIKEEELEEKELKEVEKEKTANQEMAQEGKETIERTSKKDVEINISKGIGFSGKIKPIGFLSNLDKLLGLDGKSVEVIGNIEIPKFTDSNFKIIIPTSKTIIPETIKIKNREVKLIPGFKVDLTKHEFYVKFVKGLPEFSGKGGVKIYSQLTKRPLQISTTIGFEDKKLKISAAQGDMQGERGTKIKNIFGIKGLNVKNCKVETSWDFSDFKLIPNSFSVKGKIVSGKRDAKVEEAKEESSDDSENIQEEEDKRTEEQKKADQEKKEKELEKEKQEAKGTYVDLGANFFFENNEFIFINFSAIGQLLMKDFAKFWLDIFVKDNKLSESVMKLVPDFKLKDVSIKGSRKEKTNDEKYISKKEGVKDGDFKLNLELKVDNAEIKLGEFVRILSPEKSKDSDLATYLDKFSINKMKGDYYKEGIRLSGDFSFNGNPLIMNFEVCKDTTDLEDAEEQIEQKKKTKTYKVPERDDKWYALFYISSPDKWLLSKYIPDFLSLEKLFPQVDKKIFEKYPKDILEFEKSFLYVSTKNVNSHKKMERSIVQGVGFSGKAKFTGFFEIFDKIFCLKGEPAEFSGDIKIPKFVGSRFAIKIPLHTPIVPETIIVNGKKVNLIQGFTVDLAPCELALEITESIPNFKVYGSIETKIPFIKEKLLFGTGVELAGQRLKIYGDQKNTINDVFGIKGFALGGGKIGLVWDFGVSQQIASAAAGATFGVGELLVAMPVGMILGGQLSATTTDKTTGEGKVNSNLKFDTDFSLHSTKGIDVKYSSNGTLIAKDFAQFWMNVFVKDPKITQKQKDDFLSKVPPFIFEEVKIDGAWSEEVEKKFEMSAKKVELIPDISASMAFKISADGISGSGSMSPLLLPNKNDPKLKFTKMASETEGPEFNFVCDINPIKFVLKSDARLWLDLGPVLGKIDTATKLDLGDDKKIKIESKTSILGMDTELKISGEVEKKLNIGPWEVQASFITSSTGELSKALSSASSELKAANEKAVKEKKSKMIEMTNSSQKKILGEIENSKNKASSDVDKFFKDSKNSASYAENILNSEIKSWEKACSEKPWYEKGWCDLFQVVSRKVAIEAVKLYKNVGADLLNSFAQAGIKAVADVGQFFVAIGPDAKKNFELLGKSIEDIFTKAASDVVKTIDDLSKSFVINALKLETKLDDIKEGKLPKVEYDITAFGRRSKETMQLDIKNPTEFITKVVNEISKTALSAVSGKIDEAEKKSKEELSKTEKKAEDAIKDAEKKAAEMKK